MKTILLSALAVTAMLLTSCKKEHTCTCTENENYTNSSNVDNSLNSSDNSYTSVTTYETSKSKAEVLCNAQAAEYNAETSSNENQKSYNEAGALVYEYVKTDDKVTVKSYYEAGIFLQYEETETETSYEKISYYDNGKKKSETTREGALDADYTEITTNYDTNGAQTTKTTVVVKVVSDAAYTKTTTKVDEDGDTTTDTDTFETNNKITESSSYSCTL